MSSGSSTRHCVSTDMLGQAYGWLIAKFAAGVQARAAASSKRLARSAAHVKRGFAMRSATGFDQVVSGLPGSSSSGP